MNQTLPVHLNFMQKALNGAELRGTWPIKQLKRLNEALMSDQGDIQAELTFARLGRVPFIEGHITTTVQLKCQRCMQAMPYTIDTHFKLGMVINEAQIEKLPADFEPYLVESDTNHLPDMLEDELLLALPLVAMHEHECSEYLSVNNAEQLVSDNASENKENPFSVLKDLL